MGSHWKRTSCSLVRRRRIFAPIFVSCNVILVRALLARHLPLHGCALVGRKQLQLDALIAGLFLLVASVAISFSSAGVIAVSKFAMWVHVILAKYY